MVQTILGRSIGNPLARELKSYTDHICLAGGTRNVISFEQNYFFDSGKFGKRFGVAATPPKKRVKKFAKNLMIDGKSEYISKKQKL